MFIFNTSCWVAWEPWGLCVGVLLGSLGVKLSTVCVVIEARTPHFLEIQKKQRVIITSKIHFDVVTYPFHLPYYCSTTIVLLLLTFFVHAVQSMISFFFHHRTLQLWWEWSASIAERCRLGTCLWTLCFSIELRARGPYFFERRMREREGWTKTSKQKKRIKKRQDEEAEDETWWNTMMDDEGWWWTNDGWWWMKDSKWVPITSHMIGTILFLTCFFSWHKSSSYFLCDVFLEPQSHGGGWFRWFESFQLDDF